MSTLEIRFVGQDGVASVVNNITAEIHELNQTTNQAKESGQGFFSGLLQTAGGFLAANVVGGITSQVKDFIGSSISDAREANGIFAQTEAAIKSTGGAAGMTAEQIRDMAGSMSAAAGKSLFDDDDIQKGDNLLLTFTNIKETLPNAQQAMVDMATAMHTDVSAGAIQLGKALNDPEKGITALTRVGVTFTDEQKNMIKALQESGDMAGAQTIILNELNKEFGGSADAAAKADGGMAQFKAQLGDVGKQIGGALLPAIGEFTRFLTTNVMPIVADLVGQFTENLPKAIEYVSSAVGHAADAFGSGGLGAAINVVLNELLGLNTNIGFLVDDGLAALQDAIAVFTGMLGGEWTQSTTQAYAALSQLFGSSVMDAIERVMEVVNNYIWVWRDLGSTITAVATQLMGGNIAGAWAALTSGFRTVISDYATYAASLGALLLDTGKMIVSQVAIWAQQFIAWVAPMIPPLLAQLNALASQAWGWIQQQTPVLLGQLQSWGQQFVAWVAPMIPPLLAQLSALASQAWSWIQQQVGPLLAQLQAWGQQFVAWVVPMIPPLLSALGGLASQFIAWIQAQAAPLLARLSDWANAMVAWIPGAITDFLARWPAMLNQFLTWIGDQAGPLLAKLGEWALQFIAWIVPMIPGFLVALAGIAAAIVTFIGETAYVLLDNIITKWVPALLGWIAEKVVPALPGIWQSFTDAINGLINDAATWIKDQVVQIGANIIDGIIKGVENGISALEDAVSNAAQHALDAAKDALGIHSPSQVMALLVGKPMIEGIVMGIHDAFPLLDSAMNDLGDRVSQALRGVQQLAHDIMKNIIDAGVSTSRQMVSNFDQMGALVKQASDLKDKAVADLTTAQQALDAAIASGDSTKIAEARQKLADANTAYSQANIAFGSAMHTQQEARAALAAAQAQAAEISKTNAQAGADFLALRSKQIFELIGLEQQQRDAQQAGNTGLADALGQKMDLVKQAQDAELVQYQQHADDLAAQMAKQAQDIAKQGTDAGDGFVQGVIAGIAGQTQALSAAMIAAVQGAVDAMRAALGIHSPSLVAARMIGLPLMQGVAAGITGGAPLAAGAMQGAAGAIVQAGQTTNNYYNLSYETRQSTESAGQDIRLLSLLNG